MQKPSPRALISTAIIAFALVAAGTAGAAADRLITSADIKDGTIKTADFSAPVKKALKSTGKAGPQGVAGLTGAQGPRGEAGAMGAQGPRGETGPAGGSEPDQVYSWTVTFTGDGVETGLRDGGNSEVDLLTGSQVFPALTRIQGLRATTVDGNFSTCARSHWVALTVVPESGGATSVAMDPTYVSDAVFDEPVRLALHAGCYGEGAATKPLPSFTARFTFSTTALSATPTAVFN